MSHPHLRDRVPLVVAACIAACIACGGQPLADPEQSNSFDGTDTGHPLLDSIRLASRDVFQHPPIDVGGGGVESVYPRSNLLADRLLELGQTAQAFRSIAKFYPNTLDMRLAVFDSGRFRAHSIGHTFVCVGSPSDTVPPTIRGAIRPAAVTRAKEGEAAYVSWASTREIENFKGIPDFDFCLDLNPTPDTYQLVAQRNYSTQFSGEEELDSEARLFTNASDGTQGVIQRLDAEIARGNQTNPEELADILATRFRQLVDGPLWSRASSNVRLVIDDVFLPATVPGQADRLGTLQRSREEFPDRGWINIFEKTFNAAEEERAEARGDAANLRVILKPDPPMAATNADIALAMAAALGGTIVDEILMSGAASILSVIVNKSTLMKATSRFVLAFLLFAIDALPLVVLLANEVQVSRWRGYAITGRAKTGTFSDAPLSYAITVSMTYLESRVAGDRVTLLTVLLCLVLFLYLGLVTRRFYNIFYGPKSQSEFEYEMEISKGQLIVKNSMQSSQGQPTIVDGNVIN